MNRAKHLWITDPPIHTVFHILEGLTNQAIKAIKAFEIWLLMGGAMSTVSISQLKDQLSEYLNRVAYGRERIIVASRGKPKAAVISLADLERLEELEDAQAGREALAEYERGETLPLSPLTWPTLDGGRYLGGKLSREELYDDDGR